MFARRAKASGNGLVWLVNQDTEPQLAQLAYTVANTAATFAYVPGTSLASGISQLKGKPVYYTEFNETLGTEGDIILLDPMEYVVAVKSTGIKASVSAHLRFDYDESVFKYTLRMDARPYWDASLTRFKGSNALSPVVTLESTRNS
jgi:HK97 family phage major capsid protein